MLRADQVSVTFGSRQRPVAALSEVSITLPPGQRLGLTGPSGSGKTTLAQVLALLRRPDRGRVSLDGRPVTAAGLAVPRPIRRQVQLLWQSPRAAVDPRMRLDQVILEPLAAMRQLPAPAARGRVLADAADAVGLTGELLTRRPHEVSDGQLQRVALARALVLQPRYLICDEPTAMVDVSTQASLLDTIATHQARHDCGVLLITHDRLLAAHWCDTVVDIADLRGSASYTRPGTGVQSKVE
jgi:ABC-type dipeptide/oligopeptide/nickel transport system ATPase subunit